MNPAILILLLINFSLIGLLPLLFFRRDGQLTSGWLMTAMPFFVAVVVLILIWLDVIKPWTIPAWVALLSVPLSVLSIGLLGLTVGVHRVPLALWHQDNDAPVEIVTWGPYARIRHPFYTSFLLAFVAAVLFAPHYATLALLIYVLIVLTVTAKGEEQRLSSSKFGAEYSKYMTQTGRFLPSARGVTRD